MRKLSYMALILASLATTTLSAGAAARRAGPKLASEIPLMSVQEHYSEGLRAVQEENWAEVLKQMDIVVTSFPDSPFAREAPFYQGVAHYWVGELERANDTLSKYLMLESSAAHFEEVFEYKFAIAEGFRTGYRMRAFGWDRAPRWQSGKEGALEIYDEIFTALPSHELAAKSLYSKAELLEAMQHFPEAADRLHSLINRFPRHALGSSAYLALSRLYLNQAKQQTHNPDLFALAEVNLRKFRQAYPTAEAVDEAEASMHEMKEVFAEGLYDTGQFYERVLKPDSAKVYYSHVIHVYPTTAFAEKSRERLGALGIT